jgi:hypothetical protein
MLKTQLPSGCTAFLRQRRSQKYVRPREVKDLIWSGTGILREDTNCQYYSGDFILLPVTDSVILTAGHMIAPDLQQLIAPMEHQQLMVNEQEMQATLNSLETLMQQNAPDSHQQYVELGIDIPYKSQITGLLSALGWPPFLPLVCFCISFGRRFPKALFTRPNRIQTHRWRLPRVGTGERAPRIP